MSHDGEAIQEALDSAISSVLAEHSGSMTTRWVALVETIDEEGERGLWTFTSPGATPWDTLGLLGFAQQVEQAKATADRSGD